MSAENNILLPNAGVDLFLKDKETIEAARSLVDDWRFARVNVNVEEGDVETAIRNYAEVGSPSLIIIETDTTDDSFIERLGKLSENCAEDTNAIIIGPVNDVNLYRNLTSLGISDYLVRPVAAKPLSEVIAATLIDKLGAKGKPVDWCCWCQGGRRCDGHYSGTCMVTNRRFKPKNSFAGCGRRVVFFGGWCRVRAKYNPA